jgi:hypothetical protein
MFNTPHISCHQSVSNAVVTRDACITSVSTLANVLVTSNIMKLIVSLTCANIIRELYVTTDCNNNCNFYFCRHNTCFLLFWWTDDSACHRSLIAICYLSVQFIGH